MLAGIDFILFLYYNIYIHYKSEDTIWLIKKEVNMKYCSECGAVCEDNAAFCQGCGRRFISPAQNTYGQINNQQFGYNENNPVIIEPKKEEVLPINDSNNYNSANNLNANLNQNPFYDYPNSVPNDNQGKYTNNYNNNSSENGQNGTMPNPYSGAPGNMQGGMNSNPYGNAPTGGGYYQPQNQNNYNQNGFVNQNNVPSNYGDSNAVICLVMGIISMLFCYIPIVGLVLSIIGMSNHKIGVLSSKKTLAQVGFALSIVALIISVIIMFVTFGLMANL